MADNNTLLTYQSNWEFRYFDLATASQQAGDYVAACMYGETWLIILGLGDKLPKKPTSLKNGGQAEMDTWRQHFFQIQGMGGIQIKATIDRVRNDPRYRKNELVPIITNEVKH